MRKTSGITDVTPMPTQQQVQRRQGGRSLAEIAGMQGDWQQQPDESGNLLTALAKGTWAGVEVATLGIPKLLYTPIEKTTGFDVREMLRPKGFQERVGVGIGGAAGFLYPMRKLGGYLTKGVARWAPSGINKFSKRFVDDSIEVMKKDKRFAKWLKAKVKSGDVPEGAEREFLESLLEQPISKLRALGTPTGAHNLAHTVKLRTQFAKSFRENTPKAILKKLTDAGFGADDAARITTSLSDDIARNIGTVTEGTKSLFKFPALRLNQVIGQAANNSRLGNLAGNAIEEAVLFAGVETALLATESWSSSDVDFWPNLGGTLKHAGILGSTLGVLRMIPGGHDMPIIRTGWNRVTGLVKNKRRFRKYELEPDKARGIGPEIYLADRKKLALEVKNVYENNAGFFSHLRKVIKADKKRGLPQDYRVPISEKYGLKDIDDLMKTPKGRAELKRTMIDAEDAFFRDWYPGFLREIPGDLAGSSIRAMAISMAFNFDTLHKWMTDQSLDMEMEDVVFHAALGMFMGKRGHDLPYTNSKTGKLKTVFKERPYAMSKDFKKVDKYLEALGVNLDVGLYRAIYNAQDALSRGLGEAKVDSKDMQKLQKIIDKYKLVVPKYTGEMSKDGRPVMREKVLAKGKDSTFIDEVYSDLVAVARLEFIPEGKIEEDIAKEEIGVLVNEYEVKEAYELTDKQLTNLKKDLAKSTADYKSIAGLGFDALIDMAPESPGVVKGGDILNIHRYYMEPYAMDIRNIVRQAYLDMYNEILKQDYERTHKDVAAEQAFLDFQWDKAEEPLELYPLDWGDGSTANVPNAALGRHMIGPDSNLNRILRPHITYGGPKIVVTQKMADKIFGEFKEGKRVTPWGEAIIDKHMDALNTRVFGDEANIGQEFGRKLHIGDEMIQDFLEGVLNDRTIRQHWQVLNDVLTSKDTTGAFTNDQLKAINDVYSNVFVKDGNLTHRIEIIKNTRDDTKLSESKYSREYSFANAMNEILKHHQQTGEVGGLQTKVAGVETVKSATIADVRKLMKLVKDKLPLFDYPDKAYYQQQYKSDMIASLQQFAANESLATLKKTDGSPLNSVDRAKIMTLMQADFLSPKMRMMDLRGVRNDYEKLLQAFNSIDKNKLKEITTLPQFVDYLANKKQGELGIILNNLRNQAGVSDNTFKTIDEAAKIVGMTPETFTKTLFENLEKHIEPYLAGSKRGYGFIKPSETAAVVDASYLANLVGKLDTLNADVAQFNHESLMSSIRENLGKKFTNVTASDTKINDLLKLVYNISFGSPAKAAMAQNILARSGVYNEKSELWNWEEWTTKPKDLRQIIRDIESRLNLSLTILPGTRSLELIHERDRLDNESRYPSDGTVTITLDKYAKKYKINSLANHQGKSLSSVLRENMEAMNSFSDFYNHMKLGASLVHEGNQYTWDKWDGNNKLNDKRFQFMMDSNAIYGRLRNQKTSRRIHVADSIENPKWEEYTHQDNPVYKVIKDVMGELTLIDANYTKRGDDGVARPYNIKLDTTPTSYENEFLRRLAEQPAAFIKGTGTTTDVIDSIAQASGLVGTGYIPVFLGTHGTLIGVPIARHAVGTARNTQAMNRIAKSFIEEYKKGKAQDISEEAIEIFEKHIETWFVDANAKDITDPINLNSDGWEYKEGMKNYEFMSRDFTAMLTNIVGSKTMGYEWWDAAKGENWYDGEALAKKQLRYMKQLFNSSAKRLDKKLLSDLIEMIESKEMEFLPESIRGNKKSIKASLKDWVKRDTRWQYIEDEAAIPGGAVPELASLHKRLKKQIDAEEAARAEVEPGFKLNDMTERNMDGDFVFPGGIDDVSIFDSINIVSKSKMEAAKFAGGISDKGIETIKPVGGLPSGTDGVWIDKTVWVTSNAWEAYLIRNDIDGIKIGSSVKLAGERHLGPKGSDGKHSKGIYMSDYNTMEELLSKTHGKDKVITLPIETFAISQFHKADKKATMPIQLSADLTTPELNQSFFEWKFKRPLMDFINDSGRTFGSGDISNILAKLRTADIEASTEHLAIQEMWNGMANDPTFMPFSRNVRNDLMRQFLFDRGVFTPFSEFGTQGNMVPTWADYGSARDLRFTTFTRDPGTNLRKVWTYGQIEVDQLNRNKLVQIERIRFIEHNDAARDRLVNPNEKKDKDILDSIKGDLPKDIQDLLKVRSVKLGDLYDKLTDFNKTLEGKSYEIAIVAHRTPTTRPSDKVIVGLKGFGEDADGVGLTGNSVRINHADAWHRLEADHDLDKLNYWWDTPEDILREWDNISGKVASIKGVQSRGSIDGLSMVNGETLINYNKSDRNSQAYRGIVVKSRRLLQFLKYYQNENYKDVKGFSFKLAKDRVVLADEAQIDRVEKQIAVDIQRIVDAQGRGYDPNIFNKDWINKILFGDGVVDSKYPGMFVRQAYREKGQWETIKDNGHAVPLGELEKDIISLVIKPYQRLLQLQTNIFENGEAKKVDYDSLIDYVEIYKKSMKYLNRSIYNKLIQQKGWTKDKLDPVFKDTKGKFIDPFSIDNAKYSKDSSSGDGILDDNANMLAADRMIGVIGSHDRLRMPRVEYKNKDITDDILIEYAAGNLKDVAETTSRIYNAFKEDMSRINALNSIDSKIQRYRKNANKQRRYGNPEIAAEYSDHANNLKGVRNRLETQIMANPKTQGIIRETIVKQIRENLAAGRSWSDIYGNTYNFASMGKGGRDKAINNISKQIERSVWDYSNKKLFVTVRGIGSDDYLQTLAIYNVMSELTGAGLNPEYVGKQTSMDWNFDVRDFRRKYSTLWYNKMNEKLDTHLKPDDIVNDALIDMERLYYKWEQTEAGLGRYFVLSTMTPVMDPNTVTYHKGYLMPGFDKTTTQGKFITLGLKFFGRQGQDSEILKSVITAIGRPISNQIAFLRGRNSDIVLDESVFNEAMIRNRVPTDFESEGGSPLIDYSGSDTMEPHKIKLQQIHEAIEGRAMSNEDMNLQNLNEHILRTIGLTGDITLDYIAYRAPYLGLKSIAGLKRIAEFDFIPSNAITRSGHVVPLSNFNDFMRHKNNQAFMFIGNARNSKNLFTRRARGTPPEIYKTDGLPENNYNSDEAMDQRARRHTNDTAEEQLPKQKDC